MEVTKKEVEQLIHIEKKNTFWSHFSGILGRNYLFMGNSSSEKVQLWQRTMWNLSLYTVFTFTFDEKQHLTTIDTKLNIMGKILFFGIFSVLLFLFIPKELAAYQHDKFWIYTCIKIIFLLLYLICGKVIYNNEKEVQKEAIFHRLAIEIDDENEINEHSFYSFFIRFLTYPLGLATIYICIFYFFPDQKYVHALFGMIVVSAYFITDIILLFRRKKK